MLKTKDILSPKNRILAHVLFWVSFLVFSILSRTGVNNEYERVIIANLSNLPVKMLATYFTLYFLVPKYLDTKKYMSLVLWFIASAVVFGYLHRLSAHIFYVPIYHPDYDYARYPYLHLGKAIQNIFPCYIAVFAALAIKLTKRNYEQEKKAQDLAKERLDAELKFLKGQIHPHFLFNTLNNLYSITLQDSPRASEVVMKLSNLLDYMLYEANGKQVPLHKEIQQMHNLIELESLRYGNRLDVSFNTRGDIQNKSLPPLIMLPFVENAFKHGVSQNVENSFISIDVTVKENRLILKVENSKAEDDVQKDAEYTKGIGLKNVRRRLELIYGAEDAPYDLQVFDEEFEFMIVLKVPLYESIEQVPVQKEDESLVS